MTANSRLDQVDAIFVQAVERPPEEREAFLNSACKGDSELAAEVRRLLKAHEWPRFLDSPPPEKCLFGAGDNPTPNAVAIRGDAADEDMTVAWTTSPRTSRFRIIRFHAEGGLGKVSVALDTELGRNVAFKEIRDRFADNPTFQSRFLLEAEVTGRLEHPGIVPVYSLGRSENGRPYYAMRFIQGDNLATASKLLHDSDQDSQRKRLGLRRLIERFLDVCDAIGYAHARGIVHRDLKPHNVMLGKYGETLVLDWGLTKPLERRDKPDDFDEETLHPDKGSGGDPTEYGTALGSLHYMSPEQAAGKLDEIGPATDIFGLGATLYHLAAGAPPIIADTRDSALDKAKRADFPPPRECNPDVPVGLDAICMKAMARNPQDRYASVRELRTAVQDWLDNEPIADLLATVEHFKALYEENPRGAYQERLGRELAVLSKVLQSLGRYEESLMHAKSAVALLEDLFRRKTTDIGRYEELSIARTQLAGILRTLAREEEACQLEKTNKADFQRLVQQSERVEEVREELMTLTLHIGHSVAEAERLLREHRTTVDTIHFDEDPGSQPMHAGPTQSQFQKLFRTLAGENRYRLLGPLGFGGAGEVYRARDKLLPRIVALKTARSTATFGNLFFEACILARLSHPSIAPIYDIGIYKDGRPFFTTLLIQGRSWYELAAERPASKAECLGYWRRLLPGFVEICEALHHAHQQGVIHCDPKPSNVLVDEEGRPWIVDWGIAHIVDQSRWPPIGAEDERLRQFFFPQLQEGEIRGTPAYMSPEQIRGAVVDARSDVFVLGASLFHLLIGSAPYRESVRELLQKRTGPNPEVPSPRALDRKTPRALAAACMKAMASDPLQRYQTALELGNDVRRWLGK